MALLTDVLGRVFSGRSRAPATFGKVIDFAASDDGEMYVIPSATPGDRDMLDQKSVIYGNPDTKQCAAAATTKLTFGVNGAAGDYLHHVLCNVTGAGTITITEGGNTIYPSFAFAAAVAIPVLIPVGHISPSGGFAVVLTGAVTAVAVGSFT